MRGFAISAVPAVRESELMATVTLQPEHFEIGDYLTDGRRLLHVEAFERDGVVANVTLENCATLELIVVPVEFIRRPGLRRVES